MNEPCYYFKFILLVTGAGERENLPKLFRSLSASGVCSFQTHEKIIGQRRPIKSSKKIAKMVGKPKSIIPDKDFEQIAAPARRYIQANPCHRVLLIDDLEGISEADAIATFNRYRQALDSGLGEKKNRASVHFLVNMLEAYFFADSNALNQTLQLEPPVSPYDGDVETIRHPKGKLKQIFPAYKETEHPGLILDSLDLDVVLAKPKYCASLRTCIKWIVDQIDIGLDSTVKPDFTSCNFDDRFHFTEGQLYTVTTNQ